MVPYYGDFPEDHANVRIRFNTFSSDDPSASVTITDLVDADIKVYKDGGTTEIATDGASVAINFDSRTGAHIITIDTSAHSDYSTGSEYGVLIEGTTVDGATITAWVGCFSIERAGGALALLKTLTTAVADVPTVAEFEARSLVSADYVVVGDTIAGVTAVTDVTGDVKGNVDGTVASVVGDVGGNVDGTVAGVTPEAAGVAPTAVENADALLDRNMATGADTETRSARNALRQLRNKWSIAGTTLTVTKEDDATQAWTSEVAGDANADPIISSDPA